MAAAPFRVGSKELHLYEPRTILSHNKANMKRSPNITVALMRTPALGPNYAKFHVPLWFSKLDLRDYLYHVYNVRITGVRSYVKQQRVEMEKVHGRIKVNRWHRPRAKKFMTVELERPFVWPAEPEDLSAWNKDEMEASRELNEKMSELMGPRKDTMINEDRRKSMREQARALLEGRVRWKPSVSSATMLAQGQEM